jgi:hypothetical protein
MPCYYFRNSAFYRWPLLDGAVVGTLDHGELCINSHSPRGDLLKSSAFAQIFGTVTDPRDREAQGRAYIADCKGDRSDVQGVLQDLQAKYGRPALMTMGLGTLAASLSL